MSRYLILAFMLIGSVGIAKKPESPAPTEPAAHPDFGEVTRKSDAQLRSQIFDPEGARIKWTTGYRWMTWRQDKGGLWSGGMLNMKRKWGWMACGLINGKNRLGGYVGERTVYSYVTAEGEQGSGDNELISADCPVGQLLQAEMLPPPNMQMTLPVSVAEELGKLADLKAKGVLTPAEFEAQKAKLLAR